MESLPVDVVPDIAKHLAAKDLAACCAVSNWWRDAFGSDEVWKPLCDMNLEEYLRTTPCRVEPKFVTPEAGCSTLSPMGRWRTAYMRQVHLRSNWVNGNCVEEDFSVPPGLHEMWFFNNDLIIHTRRNLIELRDTTVNPSVCVAQCEIPFTFPVYRLQVVQGNTIVIWNSYRVGNVVVQVIEVNTETYKLSVKQPFISGRNCEMRSGSFVLVNNVFLSNDNDCIYIRNFENGTILKTEPNPLTGGNLRCINSYENCDDVIVTAGESTGDYHHYFVYSVKELRFLEFTRARDSHGNHELSFAIVNNFFALFSYEGEFYIYDYRSSSLIHHIQLPRGFYSNHILGDSLVFITKEEKLMQVSLSTRSVRCLHSEFGVVCEFVVAKKTCCLRTFRDLESDPVFRWKEYLELTKLIAQSR